jgi:hypothetical protein
MKQTVYHRCGHESHFQTTDNRNSRITRAEELGKDDCRDCMTVYARENDLPDLEGSVKQRNWAFEIRHRRLTAPNFDIDDWDADECDSKYWIDRRHRK